MCVTNPHLVHGCGRITFPHFKRFGSSQPRKPDPTDLVPSKAVVEEDGGIVVHGLRLEEGSTAASGEKRRLRLTYFQVLEEEPCGIKSWFPFHFGKLHLLPRLDSLDLQGYVLVRPRERRCLEVYNKVVFGSWVRIQDLLPGSARFRIVPQGINIPRHP